MRSYVPTTSTRSAATGSTTTGSTSNSCAATCSYYRSTLLVLLSINLLPILVLHGRKTNLFRIFSEIDGLLDFNEILVNGSVLNAVSMDNISFFCGNPCLKSYQHLNLFISYVIVKKMKLFIFHIYCMLQKTF